MKKKSYTHALAVIAILVCCVFLGMTHAGAAQKPKPVDGLMEMFESFNELEEEFRENKWDEAEEVVARIEKEYKNMINELNGKADSKLIHKFGFVLGSFKKTLAQKDPEALEKPFMMIQELFLDLMDHFDYAYPPVLKVLNRWLDESKEYLEADNYQSVADELEEIEHFKDRTVKAVTGNDALVSEFFEQAEKAQQIAAAEKKDKEHLEKTLKSMDSIILKLMK